RFTVSAGATQVKFRPPAGMPPGRYPVLITISGVTAPPVWWIQVP
ncbi:MAG: hypothetical protein JF570_11960, partial [Caulobacter sp.]|nr:hypothetical protein [Caulobacter sp.]